MPWRHPNSRAQQVASKGFPSEGARGKRDPLLPRLPPRELGSASGAGRLGASRASRGGAEWWQASSGESSPTEPGVGVWNTPSGLPALPTVAQREAPNRTGLRSLLLPPLLLAGAPRTPACLRPGSGECEDSWRGSAPEAPDSLGAHLGEFLPSRVQEFLHQLRAECVQQPQPPKSQHQRGVSEHCLHSQCSNCFFLSDLRGQTSYSQNSLKEILHHQIPTLGPLRTDHAQFTKIEEADKCSGEGSGHRRQRCPFRVRFADETLQDAALRYWERSLALQQGIMENGPASQSAASKRVCDSVGRWLESLPKALYPRAEEEAVASSPYGWDCPGLPLPELQGHLSEDTCMNSSLPLIPRATTQRQQRELKPFLEQVDKSPCSRNQKLGSFLPHLVLHKVLNRGRRKGYQLLLPSITRQRAQR